MATQFLVRTPLVSSFHPPKAFYRSGDDVADGIRSSQQTKKNRMLPRLGTGLTQVSLLFARSNFLRQKSLETNRRLKHGCSTIPG